MSLFVFGLGYSALATIRAGKVEASGTARAAKQGNGVETFAFEGDRWDPRLTEALAQAELLLVSIPPGPAGDPTLNVFAPSIRLAAALKRIVYLSTVGVYGDHGGEWVDETSETRARSPRGGWRLAAEAKWRELGAALGIPVDVLRLAGIYGPHRNALAKLRGGESRRIVKPGQVFNRVHVDDIAAVVWRLAEAGGQGGIWNVADEEPAPPQDVIAYAADLLGLPPPPEEAYEAAEMSEMARSFYADNRRVSIGKLKRELGFSPRYPTYREGLSALAATGEGAP